MIGILLMHWVNANSQVLLTHFCGEKLVYSYWKHSFLPKIDVRNEALMHWSDSVIRSISILLLLPKLSSTSLHLGYLFLNFLHSKMTWKHEGLRTLQRTQKKSGKSHRKNLYPDLCKDWRAPLSDLEQNMCKKAR